MRRRPLDEILRPRPLDAEGERLGRMLFEALHARFPEVELVGIRRLPNSVDAVWVFVSGPEDEEHEMAVSAYAAEVGTDLLLEHGRGVHLATRATADELS